LDLNAPLNTNISTIEPAGSEPMSLLKAEDRA
jgi:hypothetical protein